MPEYLDVTHARVRFGQQKFGSEVVVAYWLAFLVLADGLVRSLYRLGSKSDKNFHNIKFSEIN